MSDQQQPPKPKRIAMNLRTVEFHRLYAKLPAIIQQLARLKFRLFVTTPSHPSLRHHQLRDSKQSRHTEVSFSVSINIQYRAIYFVAKDGVNIWYWIGTHAEYDKLTGG